MRSHKSAHLAASLEEGHAWVERLRHFPRPLRLSRADGVSTCQCTVRYRTLLTLATPGDGGLASAEATAARQSPSSRPAAEGSQCFLNRLAGADLPRIACKPWWICNLRAARSVEGRSMMEGA